MSSSGSSKTVKSGIGQISIQPKEPLYEIVLRLVWRRVDPEDFDSGTMAGHRFLPRPDESRMKNAKVFSRRQPIVLERKVHRLRPNEVGGRKRRGWNWGMPVGHACGVE